MKLGHQEAGTRHRLLPLHCRPPLGQVEVQLQTGSGHSIVRSAFSRAVAEGAGRRSAMGQRNRWTGHPPSAMKVRSTRAKPRADRHGFGGVVALPLNDIHLVGPIRAMSDQRRVCLRLLALGRPDPTAYSGSTIEIQGSFRGHVSRSPSVKYQSTRCSSTGLRCDRDCKSIAAAVCVLSSTSLSVGVVASTPQQG